MAAELWDLSIPQLAADSFSLSFRALTLSRVTCEGVLQSVALNLDLALVFLWLE